MALDLKPVLHFVIDFSEKKRHLGIPLNPYPFHKGGRYHIESSPLICSANQWTGFYMMMASVMKALMSQSRSRGKS